MLSSQQMAHREYLKSATWKDIRKQVLERDRHTCRRCHKTGNDVHHKHYKNWGNEKLNDLITLCRACHEQLHKIQKGTRKSKAIGTTAIYNYLTKSQKQDLINRFNLNIISLHLKICIEYDNEVCTAAAKILGYKFWYVQSKKFKEHNAPKTKKQIKKENTFNRYERISKMKNDESVILISLIMDGLLNKNITNFNLNNLLLNKLKSMQEFIIKKFRQETIKNPIQTHSKNKIQSFGLKKLPYEDSIVGLI